MTTRVIPGLDGRYYASSDGRIFGPSGKELSTKLDKWGYLTVGLHLLSPRKKVRMFVHRLVALAFIPCEDPDKYQINHRNEVKTDNSVGNLEWCNNDYNQHYGTRTERSAEHRSIRVLRLSDTGEVIGAYKSATDAARKLGLCQSNIWAALNGKREKAYGSRWVKAPHTPSNLSSRHRSRPRPYFCSHEK